MPAPRLSPPTPIRIEIVGLGPVPSFKNSKLITRGRLITSPAKQQWMERCIRLIESQLSIAFPIAAGETPGAWRKRLRTAWCLPLDDSLAWMIPGSQSVEIVEPGKEGAIIMNDDNYQPTIGANSAVVFGEVYKYPAELKTMTKSGARFLAFTLAYRKQLPGGTAFTEYWRVLQFGKQVDEVKPLLVPGTVVMVRGEVGIEKPREGSKGFGCLKIVGDVKIINPGATAPAEAPQEPPKPAEQPGLTGEDDTPF
jgi:single-stranded DNA-binding protein